MWWKFSNKSSFIKSSKQKPIVLSRAHVSLNFICRSDSPGINIVHPHKHVSSYTHNYSRKMSWPLVWYFCRRTSSSEFNVGLCVWATFWILHRINLFCVCQREKDRITQRKRKKGKFERQTFGKHRFTQNYSCWTCHSLCKSTNPHTEWWRCFGIITFAHQCRAVAAPFYVGTGTLLNFTRNLQLFETRQSKSKLKYFDPLLLSFSMFLSFLMSVEVRMRRN